MPKRAHNQFIERNFSSIWPVHLSGFTRLLTQLRLHFDNDLDLLLIMAAIGERTRPESWKDELQSLSVLTDPSESEHLQDPINTQSVSEFTGIPRETVRRKLMILQEKGWILRDSDGRLSVSPVAGAKLKDATGETMSYLSALLTAFADAGGWKAPGIRSPE